MSSLRPESINPLTIAIVAAASLAGMAYAGGMIAAGLGALPSLGLGSALMFTSLGSGLLLGGISMAGFLCAGTAAKIRSINNKQLAALREAEKTGVMPDANSYRLLDASLERSPLTIDVARVGGVIAGVIGVVALAAAVFAGSGPTALPLLSTAAVALGIGVATHRASRVAEDAMKYAEQRTREASRALRGMTPAVEWARDPQALAGVEYTYPRESHFVNKYMEEQAAQEAALLEDMRGR